MSERSGVETSPTVLPSVAPRLRPAAATGEPRHLFRRVTRRGAVVYVAVVVALVGVVGSFVHGEEAYLIAFTLTGALITTPALVVSTLTCRRAPAPDRRFWRIWLAALISVSVVGSSVMLTELFDLPWMRAAGTPAVQVTIAIFVVASVAIMRSRFGPEGRSLDVIDAFVGWLVIAAAVWLGCGEHLMQSPQAWFVVPSAQVTFMVAIGAVWAYMLLIRTPRGHRQPEVLAVAFSLLAVVNGTAQIIGGLHDFTLPAGPLLALNLVVLSLFVFLPLQLTDEVRASLTVPSARGRSGSGRLVAALTVAGVAVLLTETLIVKDTVPWAVAFTATVVFLVLVVSTVRQLLLVHEVRGLYLQVSSAAEGRRVLVSDLLRSVDVERHRVATQLHEQAVASYTAFASVSADATKSDHEPVAAASLLLSERLRTQAEAMRQLMLAVRPLEPNQFAQRSIEAPIVAYVDSLYGDGPAPVLDVRVEDDLYWGWATETVLLRIAQEAIRNVWRHSRAAHLAIALDAPDDTLVLTVSDDGLGFDPRTVTESGIATMRLFASFCDGTVEVASRPGAGTVVRAQVGAAIVSTPPAVGAPRLRLVGDDDLAAGPAGPAHPPDPVR